MEKLFISSDQTINDALRQMDEVGYKLLIVTDPVQHIFKGLISIGDVQRAIIANKSLDTLIREHIRKDFLVASTEDSWEQIRLLMLQYRLVFMPVIDADHKVAKVIFWEDIIGEKTKRTAARLNLPVVIMAGGFGTRLKPLTNVLPKPLLPIGEKTMLEDIIERFQNYGCDDFSISVNYKAELIRFYFDQINDRTYSLHFFTEDKPLGTAGSLHLLRNKLTQTFFVSNCDILIDEDYSSIYEYHREHNNELTIVASLKNHYIPYGTIESGESGQLVALREKPELNFLINCGMYILEPHLLDEIPADRFFHITDLIENIRQRNGRVGVFPISEKSWVDIGEWQEYLKHINI